MGDGRTPMVRTGQQRWTGPTTTKSTHRTPPGILVLGATGKTGRRVLGREAADL
ncbi:hypothetical protein ACIBUR_18170 [Streptomyces anulatus]